VHVCSSLGSQAAHPALSATRLRAIKPCRGKTTPDGADIHRFLTPLVLATLTLAVWQYKATSNSKAAAVASQHMTTHFKICPYLSVTQPKASQRSPSPVPTGDLQASDSAGNHAPAVEAAVAVVDPHISDPAVGQLVEVNGIVALLLQVGAVQQYTPQLRQNMHPRLGTTASLFTVTFLANSVTTNSRSNACHL